MANAINFHTLIKMFVRSKLWILNILQNLHYEQFIEVQFIMKIMNISLEVNAINYNTTT